MRGQRLTMKSMFDQPYPTRDFLSTYGGFLLHCGATAMGAPGPADTHPLHGELPNAPYQTASLVFGSDEKGEYIGLPGGAIFTSELEIGALTPDETRREEMLFEQTLAGSAL